MNIADLLARDSVLLAVKARDYGDALAQAATHLSYISELRAPQILAALQEREARGSTALGNRVALPHARCEGLRRPCGVFMRFAVPLDAGAADGLPVDIAFVLIAPEAANAAYLRAVGKIATILRDDPRRVALISGEDKETLYDLLTSEDA